MLGGEEYVYDANLYLMASVGLPVAANVVEASKETPRLGSVLKVDLRVVDQLMVDSRYLSESNSCNAIASKGICCCRNLKRFPTPISGLRQEVS
jgi:hypothetical protein